MEAAALAALIAMYGALQTLSDNQRQKASTIAAGDNKVTGEVRVAINYSKVNHGLLCAEDLVVAIDDIVLTPAIRPRTGEIVPVCKRCQGKYPRTSFMPGTPFVE